MSVTKFEEPFLELIRFYSVGESGEIDVAASPDGVSCVIFPACIVSEFVSVVNPAVGPAAGCGF